MPEASIMGREDRKLDVSVSQPCNNLSLLLKPVYGMHTGSHTTTNASSLSNIKFPFKCHESLADVCPSHMRFSANGINWFYIYINCFNLISLLQLVNIVSFVVGTPIQILI